MATLVVAHRNTETTILPLKEDFNKQIAWIVIHHDDGSREYFYSNKKVGDE